jgi:predicted GNAT family acetyltransferase
VDGRDVSEKEYHVTHNPAAGRFEIRTESGTARLNYAHAGEDLDLLHTEVPDALEGRGYGSALARAALDYARRERIHVIPSCPFVADYLARHPEDAALVAHD